MLKECAYSHQVCDCSKSLNRIFDLCKICKRTFEPLQDGQDLHYSKFHGTLYPSILKNTEIVKLKRRDNPYVTPVSMVLKQFS